VPLSISSVDSSFSDDDPDLVFEVGGDLEGRANPRHLAVLNGELARVLDAEPSIEARCAAMESEGEIRYEARSGDTLFKIAVSSIGSDDVGCRFRYSVRGRTGRSAIPVDARIIEDIPLPVTVTSSNGTILHANRAARAFIGVDSSEEITGKKIWSFVHPADVEAAQETGWQVRKGHTASFERHRLIRSDGIVIPVEITTSEIRWKGEKAFAVASHDLTGLHAMERALEESQQLFSAIFYTAPFAITVSRNETGAFVDANPIFLAYVGKTRDEVIGRSLHEIGVGYDRDAIASLQASIEEGHSGSSVVEAKLTDAAGLERTFLCSAAAIQVSGESCMLTMAVDITERLRAVHALRESEERFRLMADAAPVLIWTADADCRGTFFNQQWLEFVGRSIDEELGTGWTASLHSDDIDECQRIYQRSAERREPFTLEYRLRRSDGEYRWMLERGIPRLDASGDFAGFIGSVIDITERRDSEQRLREAKEHAEEITILKSAFLTNMTHEIRTPLTVILGFTSILRQGIRKEYGRFVTLIERSGRRLLLMLDSILDLAQLEAGTLDPEIERHSVDEIVHGVMGTISPIAEDKGLSLTFSPSDHGAYIETDHAVLSRILNNLIDNAVKFTEKGEVRILVEDDDEHTEISIEDTGIGIHEDFLPRIFDAFAQESTGLTRTHQGSGLGLTVSRQLIELLGGTLSVDSQKDIGSRIIVRLPKHYPSRNAD
jgi:PAS domain S-box-containing protein